MSWLCHCCRRDVEGVYRNPLMGNAEPVCKECITEWYDSGETDPEKVAAAVRSKHEPEP